MNDIPGFIQLIPGSYKGDKPISITGNDKGNDLKSDCINASILYGVRYPILFSFALDSRPRHKIYKTPKIKLLKNIKKSGLSLITFYLEEDDHKPVDFRGKRISFTCELTKK